MGTGARRALRPAEYRGPDLELTGDDPRDVASALLRAARDRPAAGVGVVGADGRTTLSTYPELLTAARRILGGLRADGVVAGDHVVLAGLPLDRFFPAFWACVLGGIRPVAIAEPAAEGSPVLERLRHTCRLLGDPLVLTDSPGVDALARTAPVLRVADVSRLARHEPVLDVAGRRPDDDVLLVLSSGSTGAPKACRLTERALVRFAASSRRILDLRPDDVTLNWLPLDHSGALLLYHLLEVFAGCTNVHAPTDVVLADPVRWLDLMAEHRVTHTWAPTFAYQLVVDAIAGRGPDWDLSRVRALACGGEQVLLPVLRRFVTALGPCGVEERHVVPMWGMAETTTAITYGRLGDAGSVVRVAKSSLGGVLEHVDESGPETDRTTFVAVGPPAHETEVRVVDDRGAVLSEDRIGRLQLRSARVTPGYLDNPEATAAAFVDGDWLETGDLAFLSGGQVVVTGRHKDVIVLNGGNHFAHEVEEVAATVPGVRIGSVAACGVPDERTGSESLAVFFVSTGEDDPRVVGAVRQALYRRLRLTAGQVIPVAARDFPRTPAGKVQRGKLRDRLLSGAFAHDRATITRLVAECVAEVMGGPVDDGVPFYEAGLSSVLLVRLRERLESRLGRAIPTTALFEHPTIAALAGQLAQDRPAPPPPAPQAEPRAEPLPAPPPTPDRRIAIVGMAARFPGANSVEEFWANLRAGVDSTRRFTADEAAAAGVPAERLAEPDRVLAIGAIDDVDAFDASFFGMTPAEARLTDPAQRLFLQSCYHALEHAGYAATPPGTRVGVFAGSGMNLYGHQGDTAVPDGPDFGLQAAIGRQPDFLATRVAYRLGLTGPAIAVQTACSTSLVAVHLGVQALVNDEADVVLAGAAAVHAPQESGYRHQPGSILSPSGYCRPFDASADGTVGGNGVGVVVLKRLDRALADGDTVHAVVLGSAVNNDGAGKVGFTAPGVTGQVDVVRQALRRAGVPAETISYVEAHGTGTELGDPVEFTALSRALATDTDRRAFCAVGSVKGNIGHLDSCAGMAGLIKTVLMLRHRELVPTLNLTRPNPALPLAGGPLELSTSLREWTGGGTPRRAGVSALGVGGTNAHVVLEEAPVRPEPARPDGPVLVPLSARDPESLGRLVGRVRAHLTANPRLHVADVATSTALGRPHLPHRVAVTGSTVDELVRELGRVDAAEPREPLRDLVFAFPGQGVARRGMARDLYAAFPVVRRVLDECEQVYAAEFGGSLTRLLLDDGAREDEVWPTGTAQPALFAFQLALARLWESFGIRPHVVTGHSLGEYAALCVAGALPVAEGVRLTAVRGRLMATTAPGGMLTVRANHEVAQRIARASGTEVAAVNGPSAHVLAGSTDQLRRAAELLDAEGLRGRRLPVDRAFHTALLDPVLTAWRAQAESTALRPLRIPFVSSLDGRLRPAGWQPDAAYLVRQTREPVRFDLALASLAEHDALELGPGETLAAAATSDRWLPGLPTGADPLSGVWRALCDLYARGAEVEWGDVVTGGRRVPLPGYPFARTRFPIGTVSVSRPPAESVEPAAGGALDAVRDVVARVLGMAPETVPADRSFLGLGADSLTLLGITREVKREFGVQVPARVLFAESDTVGKLAALVGPATERSVARRGPVAPDVIAQDELGLDAVEQPTTGRLDARELVDRQLRLGERLVGLMERQLDALSGDTAVARAQQPSTKKTAVPQRPGPRQPEAPVAQPTSTPAAPSPTSCDFSLYFFGDYPEEHADDKYGLINAATEFADRHDFHAVWLPERHFHSFGALFPNPSVLAASLASRTSRIRLHAGSVVLPLHNPIRVAEEWSVVDNLSGGRAGLCVAGGWHAKDFALAPENYGRHRELVYEQLDTVRRLWAGEPVPATTGDGEPTEVRLHPRPIQARPPMFVAVVGNPDSYRRAAEQDLGVVTNLMAQDVGQLADNIALYRRTRAEHGLDPAAGRVVVLARTYLTADADRARAEAYQPFCAYLRSSLSLFNQVTNSLGLDVDLDNTPEEDVEFLLAQAYRRYCASRALIGDETTAAEVVDRLVAAGVDEIACFVDFGVPAGQVLAALPAVDRLRERYRERPLPLSAAQRRIWFLEQAYPGDSSYHEPKAIRLDGPLDVDALTGALRRAVNRHPELRVVFRDVAGEPHRVVLPEVDLDCPVLDFTGCGEEEALDAVLDADGKEVFDLATGPLMLARLLRLGPRRHVLFLLVHHIVFDSSSTAVLVRDLAACYRAWPGEPEGLPAVAVRVPAEAGADARERDLAFWRRELADLPVLRLPTDRPRPDVRTGAGASTTRELGADLVRDLRGFGVASRTTVFMSLLGAIGAVLGRFSGQHDVVVGTAVANRPPGAEHEVGLFLDTVPLRVDLSGDPTFGALAHQVRERTADAYDHREAPFDELVGALNPDRDPGRNPLFQVMVEYEHESEVEFDPPHLTARLPDVPAGRAPFDLTLYFTQHRAGLRCMVEYDTGLFEESTVLRLLDYVEQVLRRAVRAPETRLSELTSLTGADRAALDTWQGEPAAATGECLHELVEQQARRTPDAVALLADDVEVTYRELDERANRLAARLRERGVARGDFVALLLPRGTELVTALLAVLKSGAAYVPLDPATPSARLLYCAEDSGVAVLVTTATALAAHQALEVLPTQLVEDVDRGLPTDPVAGGAGPEDPAYCIYTSGSTGRPKGVVVPHRGPVNLVRWHLGRHEPLRTAQWTSLSFDVSVQEVFTTLASGATLVLVDEEMRHDIPAVVSKYRVERLFLPFTPLKYLVESDVRLPSLREVFSAGEALTLTPALRRFLAAHPSCDLHNQYGPTEASVIVTSHHVRPDGELRPPIGRPLPGVRLRIVDPAGRDVPVGVPGEIHIGGLPVARGYVGRAGQEAFAPDPDRPGERVYRTGDVGRWRDDGTVEFVGRLDDQVKIRGHRVEPGEVEVVLSGLPGVADATVVARTDDRGEAELVAYVVPERPEDDVTAFRERLGSLLPDHLVPRRWVRLDRLPYTVNGKLDRGRLPAPATAVVDRGDVPLTPVEQALHAAWCAELGLDAVSVTRTFFELGGHSLRAIRLVNRLAREHGLAVSMTEFFRAPTIRALAARLDIGVGGGVGDGGAHGGGADVAPMPSAMRRLWKRHHEHPHPAVYNVAQRVDVEGELDVTALTRAFEELVRRHGALRSRLVRRQGRSVVEALDAVPVDVPVSDLPDDAEEVDRWCRTHADPAFTLDAAPLFRVRVGRRGDRRWVVLVVLHHAICDGWSLGVLWRELAALHDAARSGRRPGLPPPAAHYTDFARWEHRRLGGARRAELESFWRAELDGVPLRPALPTDRPRRGALSGRGGLHEFTVDGAVVRRVAEVAAEVGSTPYAVLVGAFAVWLGDVCGRSDVVVAASSANRLHPGHEEVFGFVGDAVLLRARLSAADTFADLVTRMSATIYGALDHQDLPLTEVVRLVEPETAAGLFPTVLFTVVTTAAPDFPIEGATTAVSGLTRRGFARNELYVVLTPSDERIDVALEFSTDLFDEATVRRWGDAFVGTLTEVTGDPHAAADRERRQGSGERWRW